MVTLEHQVKVAAIVRKVPKKGVGLGIRKTTMDDVRCKPPSLTFR